jgi:hypothetical protein
MVEGTEGHNMKQIAWQVNKTMIETENEYVGIFRGCKTISQLDTCFEEQYDEARDFCVNDPELLERVARDMEEAYWERRKELERTERNNPESDIPQSETSKETKQVTE